MPLADAGLSPLVIIPASPLVAVGTRMEDESSSVRPDLSPRTRESYHPLAHRTSAVSRFYRRCQLRKAC